MPQVALRRALGWLKRLLPAALLGASARVVVDALHLPGYFDSLGAMFVSSLGPVPSLLAGFLSGIALSAYYPAYLLAFWVPGVGGAAFALGRGRNRPVLGAALAASTYVLGWAVVYGFVTGTLHGIRAT